MNWMTLLNQNIMTVEELTEYLHLTDDEYGYISDEIRQFPMSVTRYYMSHPTGKIRILGIMEDGKLLFQYKQAKDPDMISRIFSRYVGDDSWLPDDFLL